MIILLLLLRKKTRSYSKNRTTTAIIVDTVAGTKSHFDAIILPNKTIDEKAEESTCRVI